MASHVERHEVVTEGGTAAAHTKRVVLYTRDEEGTLVAFDPADVLARLAALEAADPVGGE